MWNFIMELYYKIKLTFREGGVLLVLKKIYRKARRYYWYLVHKIPIDYLSYFTHQMPNGLPIVEVEIIKMTVTKEDVLLAERLLVALNKAIKDEVYYTKSNVDLWDIIKQKYHQDFYEIISSNNSRKVAEYLCNMHSHGLTYGISLSSAEYGSMVSSEKIREQKGAYVKDILVCFAEAVGALPYEVSLNGTEIWNIYRDANTLSDDIEKRIGISIAPPDIDGGLTKLKLKNGSFDERDLWSLYTAWRINRLISNDSQIAEIGAGMGKAALYANRFGFSNYTIFDLPLINIVQGWYLIKSLPKKNILLYGEPIIPGDSIKILPYWKFIEGKHKYELVINTDSFPEIDREIVEGYLRKIKTCASHFFSIQQEMQFPMIDRSDKRQLVVSEVIEAVGGFEKIYRFPFWLRKNYIEEFYRISHN
jgi:putative sugar O-methyltransferase